MTRSEITELLDGTHERFGNRVSHAIHALIVLSAISIALETEPTVPRLVHIWLYRFEVLLVVLFTAEYGIRVYAAENRWRYVLSFWGLVDLISILPAIALLTPQWQALRAFRLIRLMKLFRSSRSLDRLVTALREVRGELLVFGVIAALTLYVSAVGIYLFERDAQPEVFSSILTSLWWAIASFTTVGYGDMVPITPGGRVFTTVVLFIGLGIVAVPAAIVTTALLESETNIRKRKRKKPKKPNPDETNNGE